MEEPFFFLEIDFSHERYIVSSLAHMVSPGSYHILIGQISIKHGLNSRKRPPKLDILGDAYMRFHCIYQCYVIK